MHRREVAPHPGGNALVTPSKINKQEPPRCALLPPEEVLQSTAFEWDERRYSLQTDVSSTLSRSPNKSMRGVYFDKCPIRHS
ncbi:hypothetical protein BDV12DRAFT_181394 [Aspergillus spectabilis]